MTAKLGSRGVSLKARQVEMGKATAATLVLDLHKKLPKAKGAARTTIERQIAATDKQIDALVYELYGLTEKEIRIVEEKTI